MATMDGKHMTKDEALDLALEALEYFTDTSVSAMDHAVAEDAITAIKQARALDKMAENARELGLDYEPAGGTQVSKVWWDGEKLMAKPIPLEDIYQPAPVQEPVAFFDWYDNAHWGNEDFKEGCHRSWNAAIKYTTPPNVATPLDETSSLAAPVVPDVMTTAEGEHPEYVQGWNDCRQLMLQTRNNRHD